MTTMYGILFRPGCLSASLPVPGIQSANVSATVVVHVVVSRGGRDKRRTVMKQAVVLLRWVGGTGAVPHLGGFIHDQRTKSINAKEEVARNALPAEIRSGIAMPHPGGKFNRQLRADIYDELLKLPLRYQLHRFDDLVAAQGISAVGYAPPLGPVDPDDIIPFHVHRNRNGRFPIRTYSLDAKKSLPSYFLRLDLIDGDLHRFEEELIKVFPTKKTFVRQQNVHVYNLASDGVVILTHWYLGLGF